MEANSLFPPCEFVRISTSTGTDLLKGISREFTDTEAYLFRKIDLELGRQRTLHAYAHIYGWDVDEVRLFFDQHKIFNGGGYAGLRR